MDTLKRLDEWLSVRDPAKHRWRTVTCMKSCHWIVTLEWKDRVGNGKTVFAYAIYARNQRESMHVFAGTQKRHATLYETIDAALDRAEEVGT